MIIRKIAKVFVNLLEQINYCKHFRYDDRQRQNYGNFLSYQTRIFAGEPKFSSKSERLLKLMLFVDLFDAGVEGGRVVAVEAGKAKVTAVAGLEKTILGKECQRIGLDGLTGLLKVS